MLLEHSATAEARGFGLVAADDHRGVPAPRISRATPSWIARYRLSLIAVEALAATVTALLVLISRPDGISGTRVPPWACLAIVVIWPAVLASTGAYSERLFGIGSEEYRRVGRAGMLLLALAALVSYAGALELSRGLVVVALPALTVGTVLERAVARKILALLRRRGRCLKRVVVVGRGGAVLELMSRLERHTYAGLHVVAACVTPSDRGRVRERLGLPVGSLDDVLATVRRYDADTVAVTSASETAAEYLRRLSWQLEGTGIELLVAPGLVEVAGPRLHIRPLEGLPLLTVESPQFEGWRRVVKSGADRALALTALVLLAPVMGAIALAVRCSSGGPVLYRQERVGVQGRSFTMLKFRSMVADAEHRLAELRLANISDGPLFKIRNDPRVTPVGRWLRRLSLDELPQLLNVVGGSMSLVGPRPPLPSEVAAYDSSASRRLLVKPGLTGLWQISGRSDLSWEESIRLDLRYVENWSLATDLLILWKTVRAVLGRSGAY